MEPITAISTLFTSIKTATEIANLFRQATTSLEQAEVKMKLADLIGALADAKMDAALVQQEILDRDTKIKELEAAAALQAALRWEQPCYYLKSEQGIDEPYCQTCYDAHKKLARLHAHPDGYFACRVCGESFLTDERLAADRAQLASINRNATGW
jgi:hypothetical protein